MLSTYDHLAHHDVLNSWLVYTLLYTRSSQLRLYTTMSDTRINYEDPGLPKFDKQKYHRHLRGWFSYAFARWVFSRVSEIAERM